MWLLCKTLKYNTSINRYYKCRCIILSVLKPAASIRTLTYSIRPEWVCVGVYCLG